MTRLLVAVYTAFLTAAVTLAVTGHGIATFVTVAIVGALGATLLWRPQPEYVGDRLEPERDDWADFYTDSGTLDVDGSTVAWKSGGER